MKEITRTSRSKARIVKLERAEILIMKEEDLEITATIPKEKELIAQSSPDLQVKVEENDVELKSEISRRRFEKGW